MSRFDKHFRMTETDAVDYAREKLTVFGEDSDLRCKEIGDGNINYVFRIWEPATGKSVIIKHADVSLRSNSNRLLTTDRNRIEAEALQVEWELAPGMVPEVYLFDPVMCCLCMEDLSDHEIMRYALISHKKFPKFAEDITDFLVKTLLPTSDIVMDSGRKRELAARYVNPLCKITENLVYSDPYTNLTGRNEVFPKNVEFAGRELYSDARLRLEAGKLKNGFLTNTQALIHGDLHTGSIFVKEDSTKVIDPEFAFYGPMGYDIGNVVGNLFFAWANARVTIDDGIERASYLAWVESTVSDVIDLFADKFRRAFDQTVTDIMAKTEGFREWYLAGILSDTAGVAGLEMHRRTVGSAKVKDLTSIPDGDKRTMAERIVILAGKDFILNRERFTCGSEYVRAIRRINGQVMGA